jgi:hypothetical protein
MIKYKCGHKSKGMLIIENSSDTFANYLVWKDSTGFDGDKTECFDCYVRRISSPSDNSRTNQSAIIHYKDCPKCNANVDMKIGKCLNCGWKAD